MAPERLTHRHPHGREGRLGLLKLLLRASHRRSPAGALGREGAGGPRGQRRREGAGGPRDLGEAEDAEAAQRTPPRLDVLLVRARLGGGGAARAGLRGVRVRLRIGVGVIRFQVVSKADTRLEGERAEKQEGNVTPRASAYP